MDLFCAVLLMLGSCPTGANGNPGSMACPCLSSTSSMALSIQADLDRTGYGGKNHGLNGCMAYDDGLPKYPAGCTSNCIVDCSPQNNNRGLFCRSSWCYVDPETCRFNKTRCKEKGALPGNESADPSCRGRKHQPTSILQVPAYYSYETCGYLDDFTGGLYKGEMDRLLRISTYLGPWPVSHTQGPIDVQKRALQGVRGPMIEFFWNMVEIYFDPMPTLEISTAMSTPQSREVVKVIYNSSSSFTACVLEVATQGVDACIADIWHTKAREDMVTFLPTLYLDKLLLIIPQEEETFDIWEAFAKPFAPFKGDAWAFVAAFVLISAMAFYMTDSWDESDDFPYPAKGYRFVRATKALYFSCLGYFAGGVEVHGFSVPSKIVKLSFTFFVLISISSYTANLATILVASAQQAQIKDIDDAIKQKVEVCVAYQSVIRGELLALYPGLEPLIVDLAEFGTEDDIFRFVHDQTCPAAIVTDKMWIQAQAGYYADRDCETSSGAGCVRQDDGKVDQRRDCTGLMQVGSPVMTLPVAWPVTQSVGRSLRVATFSYLSTGAWSKISRPYEPEPACSEDQSSDDGEELGMPGSSMLGTWIISVGMIVFALIIQGIEVLTGKHIQSFLGYNTKDERHSVTKEFLAAEEEILKAEAREVEELAAMREALLKKLDAVENQNVMIIRELAASAEQGQRTGQGPQINMEASLAESSVPRRISNVSQGRQINMEASLAESSEPRGISNVSQGRQINMEASLAESSEPRGMSNVLKFIRAEPTTSCAT